MTIFGKHCLRQKESSSILVYATPIKPGISNIGLSSYEICPRNVRKTPPLIAAAHTEK